LPNVQSVERLVEDRLPQMTGGNLYRLGSLLVEPMDLLG
jgi:hypothetical protein